MLNINLNFTNKLTVLPHLIFLLLNPHHTQPVAKGALSPSLMRLGFEQEVFMSPRGSEPLSDGHGYRLTARCGDGARPGNRRVLTAKNRQELSDYWQERPPLVGERWGRRWSGNEVRGDYHTAPILRVMRAGGIRSVPARSPLDSFVFFSSAQSFSPSSRHIFFSCDHFMCFLKSSRHIWFQRNNLFQWNNFWFKW